MADKLGRLLASASMCMVSYMFIFQPVDLPLTLDLINGGITFVMLVWLIVVYSEAPDGKKKTLISGKEERKDDRN